MTAYELLMVLGTGLELDIELNSDNICCILFEQDAVNFEILDADTPDEALLITTPIGPVPAENRGAVLEALLANNVLSRSGGKASMGLDLDKNMIFMHRILDIPTEFHVFEDALVYVIALARHWKSQLGLPEAPTEMAAPTDDSMLRA